MLLTAKAEGNATTAFGWANCIYRQCQRQIHFCIQRAHPPRYSDLLEMQQQGPSAILISKSGPTFSSIADWMLFLLSWPDGILKLLNQYLYKNMANGETKDLFELCLPCLNLENNIFCFPKLRVRPLNIVVRFSSKKVIWNSLALEFLRENF